MKVTIKDVVKPNLEIGDIFIVNGAYGGRKRLVVEGSAVTDSIHDNLLVIDVETMAVIGVFDTCEAILKSYGWCIIRIIKQKDLEIREV